MQTENKMPRKWSLLFMPHIHDIPLPPHIYADCIGKMQQSWLCVRTLCTQFIPYRVYPAEQWRSGAVLISILGCRVTLAVYGTMHPAMFTWGSHAGIR